LWLILGLCGCTWLGPLWIEAMRPYPSRMNDYYQDWASARNYWVGLPVYTPHSTSVPRHLGLPSNPNESIEYNAHPPTSVLLALSLGRLDYSDAVLAWNLISLAAFLAGLAIVTAALPVPRTLILPASALLTFCHPVYGNFYLCQLTLLLVTLMTAVWALDRSGRPRGAGLLLGLAAAIKLFPAYLLVYFAVQGKVRTLLATVVSFAVLTLTTVAVLGWDTYHDYLWIVLPELGKFRGFGYNLSIAGLWHKLFDPAAELGLIIPLWPSLALARYGTLLSDLLITAVVAALAYRAKTPAGRDLAFGLTVTAMLLVSPITWDVSLVFLLVPIAVIARASGRSQWMPATLILLLAVLWFPQHTLVALASMICPCRLASPAYMLGAPSVKFYALLVTFALGLAAFRAEEEQHETGDTVDQPPLADGPGSFFRRSGTLWGDVRHSGDSLTGN
jgi:hypothetical protein